MAFSVRQEAAISICEARKDSAVDVMDAFNQIVSKKPRPWWDFWSR